jgi:predicted DNA-binding helix-hairpin-helix protein
MNLPWPEKDLGALAQLIGADGVDENVIERIDAYESKHRVHKVCYSTDHPVAETSVLHSMHVRCSLYIQLYHCASSFR